MVSNKERFYRYRLNNGHIIGNWVYTFFPPSKGLKKGYGGCEFHPFVENTFDDQFRWELEINGRSYSVAFVKKGL